MTEPSGGAVVRNAVREDVDAMVPVHLAAFSGYLNARLGPRYARAMIEWFVESNGIALVATRDGTLLGYVLGARDGYGQSLTRHTLLPALLGVLRHPAVLLDRRLRSAVVARARAVLRSSESSDDVPPDPARFHLIAIGVEARARGSGVGRRLVDAFENLARQAGAQSVALTVYPNNAAAIRLYQAAGWVRSETTPRFLTFTKRLA